MREIKKNSFFLVIPTRERKEHILNLLKDLNGFSEYISQCVIVDQSEIFIGDGFDYDKFSFNIKIGRGDVSKGVNHSRNLALGEYNDEDWLFFLDDDLRAEKEELLKIPDFLSTSSVNVLMLGCNEARKNKNQRYYTDILEAISKPNVQSESRMRLQVSSGLSIVEKSFFRKAGFYFDEMFTFWGDDWDFGFRLLNSGALMFYYPEINLTHLEISSGGQRSYKEKENIEHKKKYLQLYFYKKHFSINTFRQKFLIDLISLIRKLKLKSAYCLMSGYLDLKKDKKVV